MLLLAIPSTAIPAWLLQIKRICTVMPVQRTPLQSLVKPSQSGKWATQTNIGLVKPKLISQCAPLQDITLSEALSGTLFYVQHLDGRVLEVSSLPGEVIKPDSWKCINEEGMPVHGRHFEKGNLYIRFAVKFPESLSTEEVEQIKRVLPAGPQPQVPMSEDDAEQVRLKKRRFCALLQYCQPITRKVVTVCGMCVAGSCHPETDLDSLLFKPHRFGNTLVASPLSNALSSI